MATEISEAQANGYAMDELDVAYLAGVVDGKANISVRIKESNQRDVGYLFEPSIKINVADAELFVNMLDAYCEEVDSQYYLTDSEGANQENEAVNIVGIEAVDNFLGPIAHFFLIQRDAVDLMAEVIEMMEAKKHLSQDGILELMEVVEELRQQPGRGRKSKYTKDYFKEEFEL